MKRGAITTFAVMLILIQVSLGYAVEFENKFKAVAAVLGTPQAYPSGNSVFYSKSKKGAVERIALIESAIYPPNCTHTWVIGLDGTQLRVTQLRVVEMSCPHAFPTQKASFLAQFKGKGPADLKVLEKNVHTIAKATGSSMLTAQAVKSAITKAQDLRGKLK